MTKEQPQRFAANSGNRSTTSHSGDTAPTSSTNVGRGVLPNYDDIAIAIGRPGPNLSSEEIEREHREFKRLLDPKYCLPVPNLCDDDSPLLYYIEKYGDKLPLKIAEASKGSDWKEWIDVLGREFFKNKQTGETTWDPEGEIPAKPIMERKSETDFDAGGKTDLVLRPKDQP